MQNSGIRLQPMPAPMSKDSQTPTIQVLERTFSLLEMLAGGKPTLKLPEPRLVERDSVAAVARSTGR